MSLISQPFSPKLIPAAPLPPEDPLTEAQWKTLLSIADAVIPSVKPIAKADVRSELPATDLEYASAITTLKNVSSDENAEEVAVAYLQENASSTPGFRDTLRRLFAVQMPESSKKELLMILNVLDTRAGSLFLTGYMTPISEQPADVRESIISGWATARLPLLRQLFRSFTMLSKQTWLKTTPTLDRFIGFPRVPVAMVPGKGFDFEFIQFPPNKEPEVLETDVVIVGSGCGAGVCAKNISEAGHRVIVVEKAHHWTADHFPMTAQDGWSNLFMNGGFMSSDDTSSNVLAGEVWGGGGTVNWSASLQTQGFVRREWAAEGLPFFTSSEYQDSLDRVCERMGVSADYIEHNPQNKLLMEGARKLGYTHKPVPQNTAGKAHNCGHCTFGCGSCEKQGPSVSWLPDAAKAGAHFIEGFHAEKVTFSKTGGESVATGIEGTWTSRDANGGVAGEPLIKRKVIIKAKRVIVSGGTMQSPLLLLRSGLSNYHIGRNLHIHPVSLVGALYKEDIKPWEGPILTSVVSEYENLDGRGHGVKLEATVMLPSAWLLWLQWSKGLNYKLDIARMKNMVGYISLARDRDTGQVYPDPIDGRARYKYTVSKFDKAHILEGVIALAKIQYVAGATEIFTVIPGSSPFIRDDTSPSGDGINDARFQAWLDELRGLGFPHPDSMFVSAHQMSTCKMGATASRGVVDPQGQVWGTKGLYVADASVMPSASGVNPMVTNMAISDWISRGVARGLQEQSKL